MGSAGDSCAPTGFAGGSVATVIRDGKFVPTYVEDLRRGDCVLTHRGTTTVADLCGTTCAPGEKVEVVALPGGLSIAAHHPILVDEKLTCPAQIDGAAKRLVDASQMYNLVLNDRTHALLLNRVWVIGEGAPGRSVRDRDVGGASLAM